MKIVSVSIEKTKNEFPDIDCDFFDRDAIFDYLIKKYGQKHVAAVGTNTRYSAKNAIQDLGSVFEVPSQEVFAVTKIYNPDISVEDNMLKSDKISQFFHSYPKIRELFPVFVDTIRGYGIHAGGIIITDSKYPVDRHFALQRTSEGSRIATLWDKAEVESVGGVKMDILGLNCCGQIHNVKKLVGLDPYSIHPHEEEVYSAIVTGLHHKNIFQFDTSLGKTAFSELLPMDLEQLSTASGIIRVVGTEEGRNAYNKYKENLKEFQEGNTDFWESRLREEVEGGYSFEVCKRVLKETFGVLVYQEQLIKLVQFLSKGKMTFQDGNRVRKALDKNIFGKYGTVDKLQGNRELLKKWHTDIMAIFSEYLLPFIPEDGFDSNRTDIQDFLHFRLDKHNHLPIPKDGILNWFIVSSAYLFSIIHCKAYSVMSYEQMYQKHHYPLQFWLSALNLGRKENVNEYILGATSESKIKFLPPHINASGIAFQVEGDAIRFGLGFIAGCDSAAVDIINEREESGDFKDLKDFCSRMYSYRSMNKRVWEHLFFSGLLYSFGDSIKTITKVMLAETDCDLSEINTDETALAKQEFDVLACNISFIHPMLSEAGDYTPISLIADGGDSVCMLKVEAVKEKKSKNGNMYQSLKVTDMNTFETVNLFCFDLDINFKKGEIYKLPIQRKGDFLSIKLGKRGRY